MLHRGDKSLVARGTLRGRPVVAKLITTGEPYWVACRRRELAVYRAFERWPPPFPAPSLLYADHRLTVLSEVPGVPLHGERYNAADVPPSTVDAVLRALAAVAGWDPPPDALEAFDCAARIEREHAAGQLRDEERSALHRLLSRCGPARTVAHGDPIPANLLLHEGQCRLVDFEYCGRYLPGHDLAVVYVTGGPAFAAAVPAAAERLGIADAFTVNLGLLLCRERRVHAALPDPDLRHRRLAVLDALLARWRRRLDAARP